MIRLAGWELGFRRSQTPHKRPCFWGGPAPGDAPPSEARGSGALPVTCGLSEVLGPVRRSRHWRCLHGPRTDRDPGRLSRFPHRSALRFATLCTGAPGPDGFHRPHGEYREAGRVVLCTPRPTGLGFLSAAGKDTAATVSLRVVPEPLSCKSFGKRRFLSACTHEDAA